MSSMVGEGEKKKICPRIYIENEVKFETRGKLPEKESKNKEA